MNLTAKVITDNEDTGKAMMKACFKSKEGEKTAFRISVIFAVIFHVPL